MEHVTNSILEHHMADIKRRENWWEPVFSKEGNVPAGPGDWTAIPKEPNLLVFKKPKATVSPLRVKGKDFKDCDFEDDFSENIIIFENCNFFRCDFGGSKWKYSKFRRCSFNRTSFSVSTFNDCEFRDCAFEKIGISGNTTIIPNTLITNPRNFIGAADIFKDQIPEHISHRYQKAQLRITQSNISRIILDTLAQEGSEDSYYEAVKCRTLMAAKARYAHALVKLYGKRRKIGFFSLMISDIIGFMKVGTFVFGSIMEELVLRFIGKMNAWGASISRSLFVGMAVVASMTYFTAYYQNIDWKESLIKTCEIFFLFGFTNYTSNLEMPLLDRSIYVGTAGFGLIWYAVFITTVINKLTRQR